VLNSGKSSDALSDCRFHRRTPSEMADVKPSIVLRPATLSDSVQVADILIESRAAFMPYAPSAYPESDIRSWVQEHLIPSGRVTVAELDDGVSGLVATSVEEGITWIDQMWVRPTKVGLGIGSLLLHHIVRSAPTKLRLYTFQENLGARRFYERNGFRAVKFTDGRDNEELCPDVLYESNLEQPTP
jgi:GNAT superfamily N-acetyltransferase